MKKITFEIRKTPLVLIFIFLFIWLFGITVGEPKRVLEQAWSVCLECIGIG